MRRIRRPADAVAAARAARVRRPGGGRRAWLAALGGVIGPGVLAGLSDDDPAGITTYALLGADHGYTLLWIIPLATLLLVHFHLVAVRLGVATGKGFVAVVRQRWGRRAAHAAVLGLLFANFGTICAEYAGIAAAFSLVGVPCWISAPIAGVLISMVVVLGSFHRVEGVLLVISSTLALYVVDGLIAGPDWSAVARGSLLPRMPTSHAGWLAVAAALGTTLAPWGLAFIQSYAVDKKIAARDLALERIDVVVGSVLTGVIGMAIAIACAATLHPAGVRVETAADVARSLQPLAGDFATLLFGAGLLGASLLAAAVVPLATAYSVAEGIDAPASLDLDARHFHLFYSVFIGLTVAAVSVVAIPGLPLVPLMVVTQVVNAVLLPLHVVTLQLLAGDPAVAGALTTGRLSRAVGWLGVAAVVACVAALAVSWAAGAP